MSQTMKHFPQMAYSVMRGDEYVSLDEVAYTGPCILHAPLDWFFCGGADAKEYFSRVYDSPTWGQVLLEAIKAQQSTLDFHHSFLEDVRKTDANGEIAILRFVIGS
jgi:hypothetical protein